MQRINVTVRGLYGEGSQYTPATSIRSPTKSRWVTASQELLKLVGQEVVPEDHRL